MSHHMTSLSSLYDPVGRYDVSIREAWNSTSVAIVGLEKVHE